MTTFYDAKYAAGGWTYDADKERKWLKNNLIDPFKLSKGSKVLEVGCGMGLHSDLISSFGPSVAGIDSSYEGIKAAKERKSKAHFHLLGAEELLGLCEHSKFDMIFIRGMSWYHYHLNELSPVTGVDVRVKTKDLFKFLKTGGVFVLQIRTDFSGRHNEGSVHNNELVDYIKLFTPYGEIIYIKNWDGVELIDNTQAKCVKGGIVIATRKVNDGDIKNLC